MTRIRRAVSCAAGLVLLAGSGVATAAPIAVANHSFEQTGGLTEFNEFFFGVNPGWSSYDPNGVTGLGGVFRGTLEPAPGSPWFSYNHPETNVLTDGATDGDRVAILFSFANSAANGNGEYGIQQTLGDTLTAGMTYTLEVDVGNIAAGNAENNAGVVGAGQFFPLFGFPGYRVDLLADGNVIASESSLVIGEGEFLTSTLSYTASAGDANLGAALGIRLVNLNEIPADSGTSPDGPFDLEVDFDNVRLSAVAASVPAPASALLLAAGLGLLALRRRV